MNNSAGALRAAASSTMERIRERALSPYGRVTSIRTGCCEEIIPANTSSPLQIVRGVLSPVSAAVLNGAASDSKTPSRGTRPPGSTSIVRPGTTCAAGIATGFPSSKTFACSGRISTSARIFRRARSTARSCNASPIE